MGLDVGDLRARGKDTAPLAVAKVEESKVGPVIEDPNKIEVDVGDKNLASEILKRMNQNQ